MGNISSFALSGTANFIQVNEPGLKSCLVFSKPEDRYKCIEANVYAPKDGDNNTLIPVKMVTVLPEPSACMKSLITAQSTNINEGFNVDLYENFSIVNKDNILFLIIVIILVILIKN